MLAGNVTFNLKFSLKVTYLLKIADSSRDLSGIAELHVLFINIHI